MPNNKENWREFEEKYFEYTDGGVIVHFSGRPEQTGNDLDIMEYLQQNFTPNSVIKEKVEGLMKDNQIIQDEPVEAESYRQALQDVIECLTKHREVDNNRFLIL